MSNDYLIINDHKQFLMINDFKQFLMIINNLK